MKTTNTREIVLKTIQKLTKQNKEINYSIIGRIIGKDGATVRFHVLNLIKDKLVIKDKKTNKIRIK